MFYFIFIFINCIIFVILYCTRVVPYSMLNLRNVNKLQLQLQCALA
jgi:branched-subunit amino acid transport protein AzlD